MLPTHVGRGAKPMSPSKNHVQDVPGRAQQQPAISYAFVNHNARTPPMPAAARMQHRPSLPSGSGADNAPSGTTVITFGSPLAPHHATAASRGANARARHQPFAIEGVRTGEEVLVEAAERRRPADNSAFENEERRRQLTQLKAENKMLNDKLLKRKSDMGRQRALFSLVIDELEARRAAEGDFHTERDATMMGLVSAALGSGGDSSRFKAEIATLRRELAAMEAQVAALKKSLEEEKSKQSAQSALEASNSSEKESLLQQIDALKKQLEEQTLRSAREKQAIQSELASVQETLRVTTVDFQKAVRQLAEDAFLVAQCRMFIQQICQPGFSVVKDTSLEPVDRNRPEPTGFVLVPLTILLHGYALLPENDRRDVIDNYEKKDQQLSARR